MMKDQIKQDLNSSLKDKKEIETSVLRQLLAAILNKEKDKMYLLSKESPELSEKEREEKSKLAEEEVIGVISSETKKRREAISDYERGGRSELAEKEKKELEILQKYLPQQLSEEEVKRMAEEIIKETAVEGVKDMGKVMSGLMPKLKGRAEGALISKIVRELLSK